MVSAHALPCNQEIGSAVQVERFAMSPGFRAVWPGSYQSSLRQLMYDISFLLNQLADVLFDQEDRSIRDGLSSQIAVRGTGSSKV